MHYFSTDSLLIQYNPDTGVYRIRNTVAAGNKTISKEEFNLLTKTVVKKSRFFELLNVYFKDVNHSWQYNGMTFRKLDNFEESEDSLCSNYDLSKFPSHNPTKSQAWIIVYHWGRVYYYLFSYGGYNKGCLFDINTYEFIQWAKPKHCAPVFNATHKYII